MKEIVLGWEQCSIKRISRPRMDCGNSAIGASPIEKVLEASSHFKGIML